MLTPLLPYLPSAVAQAIKAGTSHGRLYQERIEEILTACQEEFKVPAPGSDAAEYHADLRAEMVRQMEPLAKRLPLYLARMGFQGYQVAVYKGPNVYLPGERGRMYPAVQVSATSDLQDALTVTVGYLPADEYGVESVRTIRGALKPEQALAMGRYVAGPNFQGFGPEEISDASYLFAESWLEGLLPKWSLTLSTTHIGLPPGDKRLLDVLVRMGLTYFLEDAKVSKVTLPQDGPREAFEIRKVPPLRWMDALPFRSILIQHTSRGDLDNQARITFQRTPRGDWRVESIVHTAVGWKLAKRPERDPEFSTTWAENLGEIAEEMAAVVLAATGKTNALPPAPVRTPTPAPRTPTPAPRVATPAPRPATPAPVPSVPAAPTRVDEEYTGKVAKLFSRLKASIGVESSRQSYKGTGSARADRQIYVRFTDGAVIDVWITAGDVHFGGVISQGGKRRTPKPILYGDRTPAGTFNEIERALAAWAGVDLPPEPAAVPVPTVRPATGGATNSVRVPTTYERVTAEILPGAQIQQTTEGVYQIQRDGWTATVTWQAGGLWQAQVWDLSHRAQGFPDALRWLATATAPDPLAGEITHVQQLGLSKDSPLGDLFTAAQPRVQHVFEHLLGLPPGSDTSPRLQAAWYLYGGPAVSGWLSQRGYETGTGFSNLWARWSPGNVALPDPFAELQEADWRTEAALTVALNRIAPFYTPWTVTAVRSGHAGDWNAHVSSPVLSESGTGSEKTRMSALQHAVQSRNLWKAVWKDRLSGPMGNDLERLRDALAPASATPNAPASAPGSRGDGGEDPTALMQAPVGTIVLVRGRNNVDRQFTKRRMPDSADDNVWHNSATGMVASNDIGPYRVVSTTPAVPAAPARGYFVSAQRAGNATGGVLLAGPYATKEQAEGDVNRVRSLVYRYFSSDPQAAFAGYGVAEGPRDALTVFTLDGEVNPAWEARAAAPSGPTMITVHTKRPVNRHTAPLARLLADYKARGLDDQGAWRELIKDRGLSPEIDFKALRDAYASARAQRLAEEDIEEEVPWEATHFDTVTEKYVMVTQKENGGWRTIWANGYHGGDPPGPLSERYRPIGLEAFDLTRLDDYQQRQLRAVLSGEVITGDDRLLDAWQEARNAVEPDPISSITSVPNPESLGTRGTLLIAYKDAWKSSPHAALWHARRGNAGAPEEPEDAEGEEGEQVPEKEVTAADLKPYLTSTKWLHGPWWRAFGHEKPPNAWKGAGMLPFEFLVRGPADGERVSRKDRKGKETAWKADLSGPVEDWKRRIVAAMKDQPPATWNAILLRVTEGQYTAEVARGTHAEQALWDLVGDWHVAHAGLKGPIKFALLTEWIAPGRPGAWGVPEVPFDHLNVSLHFEDGTWQHLTPPLSAVRDQWTNAILTPWAKKQEEKYKRGKVTAVDGYGTTPEGARVRAARWVAGKGVLQAPGDPVQAEGTGGSPDGVVRDKDLLYLLFTLKQFEGYPARIPWTEVGPYTLAAVDRGFLLRQDIGKRLHWQTTEAGKKFLGKTWTDSVGMELGWRAAVEARTAITDATLHGDEWRFRIIDLNMVAARISDDLRGSDRSDLLAYILETQTLAERGPPTPPPGARAPAPAPFAPRSPAPGAPAPRRAATPAPTKVGTTNESKGVRYELHGRSGVDGEFSTLSEAQAEARKHGPVRWKSPRGEPKDGVIRTVYYSDGDYEIVAFKPDDPLYVPTVDLQPEAAFVPTHHDWTVGRDVRIDGNAAVGWRVTRPLGVRRYSEDEDHLPPGTIDVDRYTPLAPPLSTGADKPVDNPRVFPWVAGVLDAAERALGVELDRNPLGMGANGQVFAVVGDHRALVVKITAEEKEVRGILRLQERARHRVPTVHAVVPLGTVDRRPDYAEDPTEGYAILRDAVTPLTQADVDTLYLTWTGPKVERETIATRLKVHGVRLYDWEKHKENRGWTPQYGQMLPPYWWADNAAFAFNYWMHQPSTTAVLRARTQVLQEYAGWLGMIAGHFSPPGQPPHPLTALLVASQGPGEVLQGAFSDFGLGNLGRNAKGDLVWFDIHWNDLAPKPIDVVIAEAFPEGATSTPAPPGDAPRSTRVPRIPPPTLPRTSTRGPQDIVGRATLYEVVVTDGSRTYLVAYVERNNYAGILSALQKRGPALMRLIYGTGKQDDRVDKLEGQPGYRFHGEPPWFVLLTGRTQRDMMASGLVYAYVEDVQPAPAPRRATPAPVRGATPAPRTATPAPTAPEKASPGDWAITLDGNDLKIYRLTGAGEGKYVARVATMLGNRRIQSFRAHPDRQGASHFAEAPDFTVTRTFGGKTLPMSADPLVRHYLPQVGYPVAAHEHVWVRLSTGDLSLAPRTAPAHASGFATGHVADAPAPKRAATPRPTARPATPRPTARPVQESRAPRERVPTEGCQDAEFAWGGVTVKVTCGAVGAKGVWHNIQVIGGAKKLFYGWNGERWSRSEIPGDDLLRAVWEHGIRVFPNGRG